MHIVQFARRISGLALVLSVLLMIASFPAVSVAQSCNLPCLNTLHAFSGQNGDGTGPVASLTADKLGNLYGTTVFGGTYGQGTVFKLIPPTISGGTWMEIVLHSFGSGSDGAEPSYGGLTIDALGNLFGITDTGGGTSGCYYGGCGTVFKVAPDGTETVLYAFKGNGDGEFPTGSLIADTAGNLYGTTSYGSGVSGCADGRTCGTVFKVAPDGTETVLYSFKGRSDGDNPLAGLVADMNGNLYGTTLYGGSTIDCNEGPYGCGTVFKLAQDGTETVHHSFTGGIDGNFPVSELILDAAGNLYSTAAHGGAYGGGTLYKLAPNGTITVLYAFCAKAHCADGLYPDVLGHLIPDQAGNLYGTTSNGGGTGCGGAGCGTIFKVAPDGTETVLYAFQGQSDAGSSGAGLIADAAGNLYGTNQQWLNGQFNQNGNGTAFQLTGTGFVLNGPLPDTTPPVISGTPANFTVEATSPAGAVATYSLPTAIDNVDGSLPVTCAPASGSTFPLGTMRVTCTATDHAGNRSSSSFTVTVVDTVPPTLSNLPANMTVNATMPAGAVVTYTTPTATDAVGVVTQGCLPSSGSTFAVGTTTVTCTARDAAGNSASASFTVTVRSAAVQLADLLTLVTGVGSGKSFAAKVLSAQAALAVGNFSLATGYLQDIINEVTAQSGKSVTVAQAAQIIGAAQQIRAALGS